MRTLFVSLLVAVVLAAPDYEVLRANHATRLRATSQHLQSVNVHISQSLAKTASFQLQDAQTDCQNAWLAFAGAIADCGVVSELWNDTTSDTRIDEVLQLYCVAKDSNNMTCQQRVEGTFLNFGDKCRNIPGVNQTDLENLRALLVGSSVSCLRDDNDVNHFCFKDLRALSHLGDILTENALNTACTACTKKLLKAFALFAPAEMIKTSIWLELVCYQLDGERCILKFQNAMANSPAHGQLPNETQLTLWCDKCITAFVARHVVAVAFLTGNETEVNQEINFLKLQRVLCITDFQGQHCFTKIQAAEKDLEAMGMTCIQDMAANTCNSACHTKMTEIKNKLGCCFGTWFNFLEWQYRFDNAEYFSNDFPPARIRTWAKDKCMQSIPLGCAQKKVVVSIVWNNINWAWYQANADKLKADLIAYLSYLLTVDQSVISGVVISKAQGGQKVQTSDRHFALLEATASDGLALEATVEASDNGEVSDITDNTKSAKNDAGGFLNSLPFAARNDPSSPVVMAASTSTTVDTGSAFATTPAYSFVLLIAALLSLFLW